MIKTGVNNGFLISIVGFLSLLNLALIFKIPLILQISGIIALGIVPGYLLCLLFRIEGSDRYENFFYWTGLSIVFDLLAGLVINMVLSLVGHNTPLSPINLQVGYTGIILFLISLIVHTGQVPLFTPPHYLNLGRFEKIFLILGGILIVGIETGIYLINISSTNLVLIFFILMIPLLLILCIIFYNDSLKRIFPFIISMVSASLMMIFALRTNYILGVDAHEEYFLFITTLSNSIWFPDPSLLLSSAISITILPTVFENFLFIDPQILFKLLYPFLFVITPLIIFTIVKRYFSELLALFAVCFFLFQRVTLITSANARTSVAIFFFALIVMVLCNKELINAKKYALLCLFITGMIFSHYTTSFLFLFIILIAYPMDLVLTRTKNLMEKSMINLPLIIFTMCLIFFWYQQIINVVFKYGLNFIIGRQNIFYNLMASDLSTYSSPKTLYVPRPSALYWLINYSRLALYVLIGFGILIAFYTFIRKKNSRTFHPLVSGRESGILIFMGCISYVILILGIFAPYLFSKYDTGRIEGLLFIILPVFLVMGVYSILSPEVWREFLPVWEKNLRPVMDFFMHHREKTAVIILLVLLVPQLLYATSISNQLDGGPYANTLNSPKYFKPFDTTDKYPEIFSQTFVQDYTALQWYKEGSESRARIFADDYGNKKITSLVARRSSLYQESILTLPESGTTEVYFFLSFANNYFGCFRDFNGQETDISSTNRIFSQKNKIFSNGAVIYR